MTAACALRRNDTAAGGRVGHVQYSLCAAPEEGSGSEHDLTGWLDDIPTRPGVRLPPRQPTEDTASTVFHSSSATQPTRQKNPGKSVFTSS